MNKSLVCILDNTYFEQFKIFCFSLLKNNSWFTYDINIFYSDESLKIRFSELTNIYEKIIFNKINVDLYEDCIVNTKWRIWKYNPFHRFEIFSLNDYSKIVYMDLDTLITGDISLLFENNFDFAAVEICKGTGMEFHGLTNIKRFNGGVLVISNKYLNEDIKNDLIAMCDMTPYSGNQTPLNLYFQDEKIEFLDMKYNYSLDRIYQKVSFDSVNVLHFIGEKKPVFFDRFEFSIIENFDEYIYSNTMNINCLTSLKIYFDYKTEFYEKYRVI